MPVPAKVYGDKAKIVGERAFELRAPAQMMLRPAMEEQDWRRVRFAPLAHMQLQAAAARHGM
ncbi:MAG: hypothetical protein AB7O04_09125, partial [Hyphomonadaceae bacterium]